MPLSPTHPAVVRIQEAVHKAVDRRLVLGAILLAKENGVGIRILIKVKPDGSIQVGCNVEDGNGGG